MSFVTKNIQFHGEDFNTVFMVRGGFGNLTSQSLHVVEVTNSLLSMNLMIEGIETEDNDGRDVGVLS